MFDSAVHMRQHDGRSAVLLLVKYELHVVSGLGEVISYKINRNNSS